MFFVGFKAPSFLHIFAIRKMKSRTPEPELHLKLSSQHRILCLFPLKNHGGKKQELRTTYVVRNAG